MIDPPSLYEEEAPGEPADEESEEESVLAASVRLRFPPFDRTTSRSERADRIFEHIWSTAVMRGELAALRLSANVALKQAEEEWADIQVSPIGKQSVTEAKTRSRPKLAKTIKDAKWLEKRCSEEMERMDADYLSASRAYTVLTGS